MKTKLPVMPHDLSVASYNIHKGIGADRRRDLGRTAAVIAEIGADIVALQEADTRFGTRTGLLDLAALQRDLGLIAVPLAGNGPAHGWHGNLLLVRGAVIEVVRPLVLPGFEPRGALLTDLVIKDQPLRVIAAHLGLLPGSRSAQTRALLDQIAGLDARPTLLMGDLNEWRSGGAALDNLAQHFNASPLVRSFPARFPMLALDRLMICAQGTLMDITAHDSPLARRASDHLPLKARLRLAEAARSDTR